jgi:L-asparagine permease
MAFDYPNGTLTIGCLPLLIVLLVIGWFGVRKRVAEIHSTAPVVADAPLLPLSLWKKPQII